MLARRRLWFEGQAGLAPERLIFIDETGASMKMARLRGWSRRGERCRAAIPHGHWKTYLSNRVFDSYEDIVDAACHAWNKLIDKPWKIMSIGMRKWAHEGQIQ